MLEPSAFVIYVENIARSSHFYEDVLGIKPETPSPTFAMFHLSNGMIIGLKDKRSIEPQIEGQGRNELAFTVMTNEQVDTMFRAWQQKAISIIQSPQQLPFGYTFLAVDHDGNGLRILCPSDAN